jgi:hypothetical protein
VLAWHDRYDLYYDENDPEHTSPTRTAHLPASQSATSLPGQAVEILELANGDVVRSSFPRCLLQRSSLAVSDTLPRLLCRSTRSSKVCATTQTWPTLTTETRINSTTTSLRTAVRARWIDLLAASSTNPFNSPSEVARNRISNVSLPSSRCGASSTRTGPLVPLGPRRRYDPRSSLSLAHLARA